MNHGNELETVLGLLAPIDKDILRLQSEGMAQWRIGLAIGRSQGAVNGRLQSIKRSLKFFRRYYHIIARYGLDLDSVPALPLPYKSNYLVKCVLNSTSYKEAAERFQIKFTIKCHDSDRDASTHARFMFMRILDILGADPVLRTRAWRPWYVLCLMKSGTFGHGVGAYMAGVGKGRGIPGPAPSALPK
jgi:hypothetical protein